LEEGNRGEGLTLATNYGKRIQSFRKCENKMENNEYSKFRNLNYEKDYDFEEFWEANKYTKDIFENSGLYAQNFKNFNDVDECIYLANQSIKEELIEEIYIAKKKIKLFVVFLPVQLLKKLMERS